jgi:RNA polymerase sigma-70 factor (ECF subfamily)
MDSVRARQAPAVDPVPTVAPSAPAPSFRELFDAHFAYVWASLRRLGVADRDREDQANEVFFRVHQRIADYDARRPVRPWLFAFAVRVASEYRRAARHRLELAGGLDTMPAPVDAPEAEAARSEKRAALAAALEHLDLDKRAVLILHDLDECAIPEVAEALGIPEGTAYSRLRAARAELALTLRRLHAKRRV